jgi:adenylate cyclase class IV
MAEKRLVELKARCADLEAVRKRLSPVARLETVLVQRDTYFEVPRGRLKLREGTDRAAQLILYDRPDVAAVKGSRIHLARCRTAPHCASCWKSPSGFASVS